MHICFFFCVFSFCVFSLLNLFKSLKNSARKESFDLKERLSNFLLSQQYLLKLYLLLYISPDLLYFLSVGSSFSSDLSDFLVILDTVSLQCQFVLLVLCLSKNIQIFLLQELFLATLFSGETSLAVKNSYLLTFCDDKVEILVVCLSKLY